MNKDDLKNKISVFLQKLFPVYKSVLTFVVGNARNGGFIAGVLIFFSAWLWFGVYQPSSFFPVRTIVTIPEGATVTDASNILKERQVVRSSLAFRLVISLFEDGRQVKAGDYYFTEKLTIDKVADRLSKGIFGLTPVKVTIPEGATTYQMSEIFKNKFERFDTTVFSMLVKDKEGYLFPDTYLFLPNVETQEIVETMERTFYERLRTIEDKISKFDRPVHEVVTMASLLEKEASDYEERRIISGVLWNRVDIGMPLQVDAVFGYIEKTETFNPKFSDLEVESPYNTYKNAGLPPGPIGSPSIEAIDAAVSPVKTDALFYLHGRDGVLRVAKTYKGHLVNRKKYLD